MHIPTHLTPPLDGLLKPPPVSTTPTKGLCLGLWQLFLGICPRTGLPPVIRKGVPLPGISTKAGARYLKPSSVPGPEQALALRMTILWREEPVLPLGMLLTLPRLLQMSCLQRIASVSPLPSTPPVCHSRPYLSPRWVPASSFPSSPSSQKPMGLAERKQGEPGPGRVDTH